MVFENEFPSQEQILVPTTPDRSPFSVGEPVYSSTFRSISARSDLWKFLCAAQTFRHVDDQPCGRLGKADHCSQQLPQRPLFETVDDNRRFRPLTVDRQIKILVIDAEEISKHSDHIRRRVRPPTST